MHGTFVRGIETTEQEANKKKCIWQGSQKERKEHWEKYFRDMEEPKHFNRFVNNRMKKVISKLKF